MAHNNNSHSVLHYTGFGQTTSCKGYLCSLHGAYVPAWLRQFPQFQAFLHRDYLLINLDRITCFIRDFTAILLAFLFIEYIFFCVKITII